MTRNDIQQILKNMNYRNGSYIKIGFHKNVATKRGQALGLNINKITEATIRLGINYKNTKFSKDRSTNQGSATSNRGIWYQHTSCRYIVAHKETGKEYLQVFTSPNKAKTYYTLDGVQISDEKYNEYVALGLAHKQSKSEDVCVMTIPIENIGRLGRYYEIKIIQ